jgi:hypothetical protein
MIKTAITIVAVLIATATASAEPQQSRTFYNERGQEVGRSTTRGSETIFFNEKGQQTGRSEQRGDGTTIFFNDKGQRVGTSRPGGREGADATQAVGGAGSQFKGRGLGLEGSTGETASRPTASGPGGVYGAGRPPIHV